MACSFPKLTQLASEWERANAVGDDCVWVFLNKKKNYVKILAWGKGGTYILAKKLDSGCFELALDGGTISVAQLGEALVSPITRRQMRLQLAA